MTRNWLYGVYDMKYKEQCVLIADTLEEVVNYLDIKYTTAMMAMQRDSLTRRRYKIIKIKGVNEE